MAVVTIEGAAGIGKSFLASQLSSFRRLPVFLEGEPGALPDWLLSSFNNPELSARRQAWFLERGIEANRRARYISDGGLSSIVDVGPLTQQAYMRMNRLEFDPRLSGLKTKLDLVRPDLAVLLVAEESYLRQHISRRGRADEQSEEFVGRILRVQRECLTLAPRYHTIVVERDHRDFATTKDLQEIWDRMTQELDSLEDV